MVVAHDIFRRAVQKGLAVLGEPSLLGGVDCGSVHIARGVQLFAGVMDQANDNHVAKVDLASIDAQYTPRVGMVLEHPTEGRFKLMRLAGEDGFKRRFIVAQIP